MIHINHINVSDIAEKHYKFIQPYIEIRLKWCRDLLSTFRDNNNKEKKALFESKYKEIHGLNKNALANKLLNQKKITENNIESISFIYCSEQFSFIENILKNLKILIKGLPAESKKCSDELKTNLYNQKELIEAIFNYELLTGDGFKFNNKLWNSYELTNALHAKTCFYCNRQYTTTIKNKEENKKGAPTLDHFFEKSENPLLRINFYNLIPSCYICNSICKEGARKTDNINFNLDENIHPYLRGFNSDAKFTYKLKEIESTKIKICFSINNDSEDKEKIEKNINVFALEEVYTKAHNDIVEELITKRYEYSEKYIDIITNTYKELNLSKEEAYRLAFGNYYNEEDFYKRPLSKLTRDIAEELGLI